MVISSKEAVFDRARSYSSFKYALNVLGVSYLIILLSIFINLGLSKALSAQVISFTGNNFLTLPLYLFIISIGYYLLNFPLNFYDSYILEHRFCLSNQKFSSWSLDQIKAGILSYVISLIVLAAFYYILRHNPKNWWLVISFFWIFFNLVLARLTPTLIIPLFFKYKRLCDDTLRERIMQLADKMKVRILDVFQIDFSKKTLKANAAFVGMGRSKRIILADTLKDKYDYDEIEVILAHEFAHHKLKHLLKLLLINSLTTTLLFYIIYKTSGYALKMFGFTALTDIAALPVIIIYCVLFAIIMQPFGNYISRGFERKADRLALSITGLKEAFISMMDKLAAQNLADRNPHPVIKFFFFDHPPIDERINLAKIF